jgi:acyl dehydratase
MPPRLIESLDELGRLVGQEVAVSDYVEVSQERIDRFAEATLDRQWIHVDRERARRDSPYHGTVAHGFLTLSLAPALLDAAVSVRGLRMAINYGLDRVRFPAPVRSGARVRARLRLLAADPVTGGIQAKWAVAIECEGAARPSCAAEWLVRWYV